MADRLPRTRPREESSTAWGRLGRPLVRRTARAWFVSILAFGFIGRHEGATAGPDVPWRDMFGRWRGPGFDDAVAPPALRTGDFGEPLPVAGLGTAGIEADPEPSADDLTLLFATDRAGGAGGTDLWFATRADHDSPFGGPQPLPGPVNSATNEIRPDLSPDGLELFFVRSGGLWDDNDIWRATRASTSDPFGSPSPVAELNGPTADSYPFLAEDALSLYFTSNRPGGGGDAIWVAARPDRSSPFGAPALVEELDTGDDEQAFALAPGGLRAYFVRVSSFSPETEIRIADRPSLLDPFADVRELPATVGAWFDSSPRSSHDGAEIFFFSANRPGGAGPPDLWAATRLADDAALVADAIPREVQTGWCFRGTVEFRNTGDSTWRSEDGVGPRVVSDPCGLATGQGGIGGLPWGAEVPPGASRVFEVAVDPIAAGACDLSLAMSRPGAGDFGPVVTATIMVGSSFAHDFGESAPGWYSGVTLGSGSTERNAGGLCMTTVLGGDNVMGWVSPEGFLELVDLAVQRCRVDATVDHSTPDAVPLWDFVYDSYFSSGRGNSYGGFGMFLDVAGEANGIGRGRSSFELWATPNAVLTPQWRGLLVGPPGVNDQSAFATTNDAWNDMRLVIRLLDVESANILAEADYGTACIRRLRVNRHSIPSLVLLDPVWAPPISTATHLPETLSQSLEMAGTAWIEDSTGVARFALEDGNTTDTTTPARGNRKTLFPYDSSDFDPQRPWRFEPLFPIPWESDSLYSGLLTMRSETPGGIEGNDPLDLIFVNFDVPTTELTAIHVTTRGSPNNFLFAASPRLETSAMGPQTYVGFFHSHSRTAVDPISVPGARRIRMMGDFFNSQPVAPQGLGGDPFAVTDMRVDRLMLPPD